MPSAPKLPRGFFPFILTESLGAFNDNFFKMLLQLYIMVLVVLPHEQELISLASMIFTIPFVLFGPWSGYLADRFSKTRMMQVLKLAEVLIMILGVLAFAEQSILLLLVVLFLLATHSAFFSPNKSGFIPETCPTALISRANGIMGMTTFVAIILGTVAGGVLLAIHNNAVVAVSYYCLLVAGLGFICSLRITQTTPQGRPQFFPKNPLLALVRDLVFLKQQKNIFLAALANSFFWLLGLIFQTNILVYGKWHLGLAAMDSDGANSIGLAVLPALLGIGIALGSPLASRWSGRKVEIGLVPFGGLGLALCGLGLYFASAHYWAVVLFLLAAGIFGGLYLIPLNAYLQFTASSEERGRVLATAGVLNGFFLVLGSIIYFVLSVLLAWSPAEIFLFMGLATFGVTLYICTIIPEFFVRFLTWLLTHTFYKIQIIGAEQVPFTGPALLVPNHVSFVDALLVGATVQRFIKFVMFKKIYELPLVKQVCRIMEVIPIAPYEGRDSVLQSLNEARKKLEQGEVVCIFAEGGITRDGSIKEFKSGLETIMQGMDCPIIPVYLHNVWGSLFSFSENKVFWKLPKKIPYPVKIIYGKPMSATSTAVEVETAVRALATPL